MPQRAHYLKDMPGPGGVALRFGIRQGAAPLGFSFFEYLNTTRVDTLNPSALRPRSLSPEPFTPKEISALVRSENQRIEGAS